MKSLFLSHVEEDKAMALELRRELETVGYRSWCYEFDSLPGQSYVLNTRRGIDVSSAFLLLVSAHSMGSRQVDVELEHAHEEAKPIFPVLFGVKDSDYKKRNPKWAQIVGTSTSIEISQATLRTVAQRIADGLADVGISPSPSPAVDKPEVLAEAIQSPKETKPPTATFPLKTGTSESAQASEWRKAADEGDASAQRNLGNCYAEGKGVAKDEVEAAKWFRKAAEQGSAAAQDDLGNCYAEGKGIAKDEVEAAKWYRKAAEQGATYAQPQLSGY